MGGGDLTELVLGAIAGGLAISVGYGFLFDAFDAITLAVGALAVVVIVAIVVALRRGLVRFDGAGTSYPSVASGSSPTAGSRSNIENQSPTLSSASAASSPRPDSEMYRSMTSRLSRSSSVVPDHSIWPLLRM